uniref:Uncharacterized protein n=1 Tax=viral metagenome TaxID=1070528 RepID=A0A6C0IZL4_9ZZZZ
MGEKETFLSNCRSLAKKMNTKLVERDSSR